MTPGVANQMYSVDDQTNYLLCNNEQLMKEKENLLFLQPTRMKKCSCNENLSQEYNIEKPYL